MRYRVCDFIVHSSLSHKPPVITDTGMVVLDGQTKSGSNLFVKPGKYLSDKVDSALDFSPFPAHAQRSLVLHEYGSWSRHPLVTNRLDKSESHRSSLLDNALDLQSWSGSLSSSDSLDHPQPGQDISTGRIYEDEDRFGFDGEEFFDEFHGDSWVDFPCEPDETFGLEDDDIPKR